MGNFKKILELLSGDEEDSILEPIEISEEEKRKIKATEIAEKKLEKYYIKNNKDNYSYLGLSIVYVGIVNYKDEDYYYYKAIGGEISGFDGEILWDGEITDEECKDLKCLINTKTLKYIHVDDKIYNKFLKDIDKQYEDKYDYLIEEKENKGKRSIPKFLQK